MSLFVDRQQRLREVGNEVDILAGVLYQKIQVYILSTRQPDLIVVRDERWMGMIVKYKACGRRKQA